MTGTFICDDPHIDSSEEVAVCKMKTEMERWNDGEF